MLWALWQRLPWESPRLRKMLRSRLRKLWLRKTGDSGELRQLQKSVLLKHMLAGGAKVDQHLLEAKVDQHLHQQRRHQTGPTTLESNPAAAVAPLMTPPQGLPLEGRGKGRTANPGCGWRVCINCGVYERFRYMTDACCWKAYGTECEFP